MAKTLIENLTSVGKGSNLQFQLTLGQKNDTCYIFALTKLTMILANGNYIRYYIKYITDKFTTR